MSVDNPYAAPETELTYHIELSQDRDLATRWQRVAGALIDGLIGNVYIWPLIYITGGWKYIVARQPLPFAYAIPLGILGFMGFLLIHGYFLSTRGQTLGKMAAGTKIVSLDGKIPNFGMLILWRYVPIHLVSIVPVVGPYMPLLDDLFVFRSDRRCVHDLLAGTEVIVSKPRR